MQKRKMGEEKKDSNLSPTFVSFVSFSSFGGSREKKKTGGQVG